MTTTYDVDVPVALDARRVSASSETRRRSDRITRPRAGMSTSTRPPVASDDATRSGGRAIAHGRTFDCAFAPRASWSALVDALGGVDEIIITCGEDGAGRVFGVNADAGEGEEAVRAIGACRGHAEEAVRVACSRTAGRFATGSADGTCAVWRVDGEGGIARERTFEGHPGEVYGICFLGDERGGDGVATCSETEVFRWDMETGATVGRSAARERDLGNDEGTPERWRPGYLFSMARGAGVLACGCSDGMVRVYGDGSSGRFGELVVELPLHPNSMVGSTSFIDEGRVLCSVGLDGTVALTDVRTWGTFRRVSSGTPLMSACGIGGGSWLAMVGNTGIVRAFDALGDASSPRYSFEPSEPVPLFCVASNESGTMLACAGAGVPQKAPALAASFAVKRPDPSRLDVFLARK